MGEFDVPVAILNFNRPHLTRRVFEVVRQIKPRRLLLIADGPRASNDDDIRLCAEVRAVFDEIDWDCEVSRKYSDTNLGSFKSNSSGLNWVFETVEEAIIIEDDCIPSLSFFRYCEELLDRYREDPRVGVITGYNLGFPAKDSVGDSYFFSAYALTWAWASWRRAWQNVDLDMSWWTPEEGLRVLQSISRRSDEWRYWYALYERIHRGEMNNGWDYQLILSAFRHSQYCIVPAVNLVTNLGFGPDGTHITDESSVMHKYAAGEMTFPMVHPVGVRRSSSVDHEIFRIRILRPPKAWVRVVRLLLKIRIFGALNQLRKNIQRKVKKRVGV